MAQLDDRKRDAKPISVKPTDRMLQDLKDLAAYQRRTVSELVYVILRNHLYGHCVPKADAAHMDEDDHE